MTKSEIKKIERQVRTIAREKLKAKPPVRVERVVRALRLGKPRKFQQHVWVRPDIGLIEIALEDVACYHEWIPGGGGDISIWRAMDNERIVGATLPLRNFDGSMLLDVECSNESSSPTAGGGSDGVQKKVNKL